jgi:Terminase small subunit
MTFCDFSVQRYAFKKLMASASYSLFQTERSQKVAKRLLLVSFKNCDALYTAYVAAIFLVRTCQPLFTREKKIVNTPSARTINMGRRIPYRQILFCRHLLDTVPLNATAAAIKAGYSPRTAKQQASRLMNSPMVQLYRRGLLFEYRHETFPEPKPRRTKMNDKQWWFMLFYWEPGGDGKLISAKAAAIKAGYSPKTAASQASRLLNHPQIKHHLEWWLGERKVFRDLRDKEFCRLAKYQ